ncbi:hypothetical protein XELAEV_18000207mg [Xenopus laevis]|uniref:Uncharacterized protein n=1 Tax=Xenopus laevis TaxID=8355 RepID=A0A974BQI8_XENLA|nr:hypothetical protein XELAEV_18000207mg [Xenopus laevis]
MLKGIFLCVLLAVLSANSVAQPTGSADPDAIMEREVRGVLSNVIGYLKKLGTGVVSNLLQQKREAVRPIQLNLVHPPKTTVPAKKKH